MSTTAASHLSPAFPMRAPWGTASALRAAKRVYTRLMTETTTRYEKRAYRETPEHYAARMAKTLPDGATIPPQEDTKVALRSYFAGLAAGEGMVINPGTMREEHRTAVVVNEAQDDWREAMTGETPTGHMVLWSIEARVHRPSDASEPVIEPVEVEGQWIARIPEPHASTGGSARIRHIFATDPALYAKQADGSGIGYLIATVLDERTVHVEFFGGTDHFVVSPE